MQTAAIPANSSSLKFYWNSEDEDTLSGYHLILHISELQYLSGSTTRPFDVHPNGKLRFDPLKPDYLLSDALYSGDTFEIGYRRYNVSLDATRNSTLPPILNAFEIYTISPLSNVPTDIRDAYGRNLSSSGLTGVMVSSFARLKAIEYLIDDDMNPCIDHENSCPSKKNKKKITAPIIAIISAVGVVLLLVLMFVAWRMRQRVQGMTSGAFTRPGSEDCSGQKMDCENYPLQLESRRFTHMQLVNITNNFVRVIGKGGFGMVYHGYSENGTPVAVKMRSQSSSQGAKEFLAEAQNLTSIHHRNLVSLAGYCKDGNYLALVYEYMPRGSLREHLNGCTFT
ncbi:putative LRR receptor-like serine/threonine-protein kinase [Cocos nucifera]|uniref:Putative LRR receptor-like serine/threonine-protein kinase n=1 Tax=Cocos nucifera TaxID=13894 RepID=A0A8K0IAX0_COCNU|nr:putative LRR receptor-like serine/threonine-protein kinase [Cocos nucifera]